MTTERAARSSVVVWFEIPSADFDRAARFYETIFDTALRRQDIGPMKLGVFPYDQMAGVSGAVMQAPDRKPGGGGALVYLNCDGRLDAVVGRVKEAGGAVVSPRVDLPDGMGAFYLVRDTEGNVVGLHAA